MLSSLATLGGLTVVSVQSNLRTSSNDRSQTVAMYAAESGGAFAMRHLRASFDATAFWSALVRPGNVANPPLTFAGNGARPGEADNPFSESEHAWYEVEVLNNRNDPGYLQATGNDQDAQVIIRSTGHGPLGAVAILEWEIRMPHPPEPVPPPPVPLVLMGWHIVL